jgi:hypothetical protein
MVQVAIAVGEEKMFGGVVTTFDGALVLIFSACHLGCHIEYVYVGSQR